MNAAVAARVRSFGDFMAGKVLGIAMTLAPPARARVKLKVL
jgi:hypothetical protein